MVAGTGAVGGRGDLVVRIAEARAPAPVSDLPDQSSLAINCFVILTSLLVSDLPRLRQALPGSFFACAVGSSVPMKHSAGQLHEQRPAARWRQHLLIREASLRTEALDSCLDTPPQGAQPPPGGIGRAAQDLRDSGGIIRFLISRSLKPSESGVAIPARTPALLTTSTSLYVDA